MPDSALPPGLAPRYLSREEAAAYVGVSVGTFDREVREGWWPQPRRRGEKESRLTWDRFSIDASADHHSGLRQAAIGEQLAADMQQAAEDAALQGVQDAARRNRAKRRHAKAA